jgi:activator of 2-hydroxyglutaryl-CoA dehydratase/predicted nucleotide-binding protein (sugar kinase/HSP70/actin superfamily)
MPHDFSNCALLIGLDIGSTTVKAVVVDAATGALVWSAYRRHETRPLKSCLGLLQDLECAIGEVDQAACRVFAVGSGAAPVAECIGACVLHEVTAISRFVERHYPEASTVIEIGGEDAKILGFGNGSGGAPRRDWVSMNDRCAGGTGVIIERVCAKLGISRDDLCRLPFDGARVHRVAGKCGVFAETDINSLHKQGVPAHELMVSLFDAIVQRNMSALARGHILRPTVLLLGGPHAFVRGMHACWRFHLARHWNERGVTLPAGKDTDALVVVPEHAVLFAALGAVECARDQLRVSPDLARYRGTESLRLRIRRQKTGVRSQESGVRILTPNAVSGVKDLLRPNGWKPNRGAGGPPMDVYLGLDGGSASTKAVLLDSSKEVLAKAYQLSRGNPIEDAKQVLAALMDQVREHGWKIRVRAAATTGYAKDVLREAIGADLAVVETVAHVHSASHHYPQADVICDVGGQDIKIILLKNGVVKDFRVNTQCSAGNGYYLQSTAAAFGYRIEDYAEVAFSAEAMPAFTAGCAVFLQSEIIGFQRQGWRPNEILAGLAAVLPKNIWMHVCQMPNLAQLGRTFVLQGGVQRNLAAVKAQMDFISMRFEGSGVTPEIVVHKHCGESGAIGCALGAHRLATTAGVRFSTSFIGFGAVGSIHYATRRDETTRCGFCTNRCGRTFVDIGRNGRTNGALHRRLIVANCEKGSAESLDDARATVKRIEAAKQDHPNLAAEASRLLFEPVTVNRVDDPLPEARAFTLPRRRDADALRRERMLRRADLRIGMPRVLNMYSTAPFFMGYFQSLGVAGSNIVWSDYSHEELYREGSRRGSIDPCYPSKLALAHVHNLLYSKRGREKPRTHIFFPVVDSLPTWLEGTMACRSCPASAATPEATYAALAADEDVFTEEGVRFKRTFLDLGDPVMCAHQMWEDWADEIGVSKDESYRAVAEGFKALESYHARLRSRARAILETLKREKRLGVVLLARPYHADPGINHGILEQIQAQGFPILTVDSLPLDADVLDPLFAVEAAGGRGSCRAEDIPARNIDDVWKHSFSENSSRKIWAAKFAARHPNLAALELSSFKCGHDAAISWTIERILECSGTPFFCFRDIDENKPSASLKMRVDTVVYFLSRYMEELSQSQSTGSSGGSWFPRSFRGSTKS